MPENRFKNPIPVKDFNEGKDMDTGEIDPETGNRIVHLTELYSKMQNLSEENPKSNNPKDVSEEEE